MMSLKSGVTLTLLFPLIVNSLSHSGCNIGSDVETSSGTIKGHPSAWKSKVSEYLGIPFAKPPIGELRWAPPQRFEGKGIIDAKQFVCRAALSYAHTLAYITIGTVSTHTVLG